MKKGKKLLSLLLTLAMVFGMFAGVGTEAKAAGMSLDKITLSTSELSSKGGSVEVTVTLDEFSADEGTVYVQLKKATDFFNGKPVFSGTPIINDEAKSISRSNPKFTVDIPANDSEEAAIYQIGVAGAAGGVSSSYKKGTVTVAAKGSEPAEDKVLSDATTFRAKVVDETGAPVEGVKLIGTDELSGNEPEMTSDAKGIAEYEVDDSDMACTYTVKVAEDSGWTSENNCTFYVGKDEHYDPMIEKVNGKSIEEAGEIVFTVKKAATDTVDKTALKAAIDEAEKLAESDYTAASWTEFQKTLIQVKDVYNNADATADEVAEAQKNLETAVNGLVKATSERKALDEKIAETRKIDHSQYSDESWAKVAEAIKEAEALPDDASADEITAAVKKIDDAVAALVKIPSWGPHLIKVSQDKLPSKGGKITVSLTLDDFGADAGTIWYRVRKKDNSAPADQPAWIDVETDTEVQISNENPTFEVTIPANATEQEEIYQITPTNKKGNYMNLGKATVTVIPSSQDEEYYRDKILSDEKTYRLKAVDENGNPVEGVTFNATTESENGKIVRTFVTNEKGAGEYTIDQVNDYGLTYDVTVADDTEWISEEAHTFTVNTRECHLSISKIDGVALADAGEVCVVVKKNPNYKPVDPTPEVKATVKSVSLAKTSYKYDGKVHKPAVVAKNNKGAKISSKSYTVKYAAGCKNVGQYTVKVTFKDDYKGTYTKTFKIVPAGTSLKSVKAGKKSFTATWKKQNKQTSGYQVQYAKDKKFAKSVKTTTVSKNTTVKKAVKKLSAKKTYYVRVRTYKTVKVGKKSVKIYSGWSAVKKVKTK